MFLPTILKVPQSIRHLSRTSQTTYVAKSSTPYHLRTFLRIFPSRVLRLLRSWSRHTSWCIYSSGQNASADFSSHSQTHRLENTPYHWGACEERGLILWFTKVGTSVRPHHFRNCWATSHPPSLAPFSRIELPFRQYSYGALYEYLWSVVNSPLLLNRTEELFPDVQSFPSGFHFGRILIGLIKVISCSPYRFSEQSKPLPKLKRKAKICVHDPVSSSSSCTALTYLPGVICPLVHRLIFISKKM